MTDCQIFTYHTRINTDTIVCSVLDAYADIQNRAERSLFARLQSGEDLNYLKQSFQKNFGITSRQFNSIRVGLEGKIKAIKELRPELITEAQTRIKKAQRVIKHLEKIAPGTNKLHQKKRRLGILSTKLEKLKADHQADVVRLCFGSKKLFRAQFNLAANGYATHDEWKTDWTTARSNQFFVLGSKDEIAGNQTCRATIVEDGSLSLQLRLPNTMSSFGKHLTLIGVRFGYGHEAIVAALQKSQIVSGQTKAGKTVQKRTGTAVSYRFVRDDKGYRLFVSVEAQSVCKMSTRLLGAIGVDVNADHLAVAETDRFGNLIKAWRIDLPLAGKTTEQAKALIGDASVVVAEAATAVCKPIVIEQLNFQKKKAELENVDPKQAKIISSFACNKVASSIKAASFRRGIEVIEVNPAYTSVIGAVEHAQRRGISVHQGAAYAIARRGLGLSELPTKRRVATPVRNGGHVTFDLPVRNRSKHVWSFWSKVRTRLKAAHQEHYRCGAHKVAPPPLRPSNLALSAPGSITAQFRDANRFPHCSGDVLEDVPY